MNKTPTLAAAVIALLTLTVSSASAQPSAPPLAEALAGDAKAEYESGKVLFGDGDFAGALLKFKSAYEKSKDARLLYNQAACEKNLRHYSRAIGYLRQYQGDAGSSLTEQDKTEAADLIKAMEPFTARLEINVDEPDADVSIDDEALGKSPVKPSVVDIGTRHLRVRKVDFEEYTRDVSIAGSSVTTIDVRLVRIVHEGRINVKASNGATISIDDRVVGTGAWSGVLPSGGHTLKVSAPKLRTYQSEVVVVDKQVRDVNVTLEAEPGKGVPTWVWITGGIVATAGAITAIGFAAKGSGAYDGPQGSLAPGLVTASAPITFR